MELGKAGSIGTARITPPRASEPYRVEPPPRKTSILWIVCESRVKKYWFGPCR